MKRETIEKLLKEAGLAEEKLKGVIDSIMGEHGKDIEAEKQKATAKDAELTKANETITQLQETVKKYDGKDPDKLQQDLKDLQDKYNTDIAAERKKAGDVAKGYALKAALQAAGVTDPDYLIYKHGGIEKFAFTEDKPIGVDDILKPYKESSPHLFKQGDGGNGGGNGGIRIDSGGAHGGGMGGDDYDKMSDAEYYAAISKKKDQ